MYAINVPTWYTHTIVPAMLSATGNERIVVDRIHFLVGELRTCAWKITGPSADSLVGHLLRSTEGDSFVHLISPAEYKGRRMKHRARPPRDPKDRPKPPLVGMMDLESMKFKKQKCDGGGPPGSQSRLSGR